MSQVIHTTTQQQHITVLHEANIIQAMYPYQQVFIICVGNDPEHVTQVAISVDETVQTVPVESVKVLHLTPSEFDELNREGE